jgi:hypothetical protein
MLWEADESVPPPKGDQVCGRVKEETSTIIPNQFDIVIIDADKCLRPNDSKFGRGELATTKMTDLFNKWPTQHSSFQRSTSGERSPWPLKEELLKMDSNWIELIRNNMKINQIAQSLRSSDWWALPQIRLEIRAIIHLGAAPLLDWQKTEFTIARHQNSAINCIPHYSYCTDPRDLSFCLNQVEEHLKQGWIEEVHPSQVRCYHRFFSTKNSEGKKRLVVDPKAINKANLSPTAVVYEDLNLIPHLVQQNDLLCSIDLTKAYYHIAIVDWLRPYMGIRANSKSFLWKVLFLGQCYAPLVFTWITQEIIRCLRSWGITIIRYLDDFLGISSIEKAEEEVKLTALLLNRAGFHLNLDVKSSLTPPLKVRHLGSLIDSQNLVFEIPQEKIRDIRILSIALMKKTFCQAASMAKLIGKLISISKAWPHSRKMSWEMIDNLYLFFKLNHLDPSIKNNWKKSMLISDNAKKDLFWIFNNLHKSPFRSFQIKQLMLVFTDAAGAQHLGWGFHVPALQMWGQGRWSDINNQLDQIHLKELWAVIEAIKSLPTDLEICLVTDSKIVKRWVEVAGGRKKKTDLLLMLSFQLWKISQIRKITIEQVIWLPGRMNQVADGLSRFTISSTREVQALWQDMQNYIENGSNGWLSSAGLVFCLTSLTITSPFFHLTSSFSICEVRLRLPKSIQNC